MKLKRLWVAVVIVAAAMLSPGSAHAQPSSDASRGIPDPGQATPMWLNPGPIVQYPSGGGVWEYGFWNAYVRSYFTANRCHGSTVVLNGDAARSANTASGQKSIAEKFALQWPSSNDEYYYRYC